MAYPYSRSETLADGAVHAVYSGFAGPATGPAHELLRRQFVDLVEELLAS